MVEILKKKNVGKTLLLTLCDFIGEPTIVDGRSFRISAGFSFKKDFVLTPCRTDLGCFGEASSWKEGISGEQDYGNGVLKITEIW